MNKPDPDFTQPQADSKEPDSFDTTADFQRERIKRFLQGPCKIVLYRDGCIFKAEAPDLTELAVSGESYFDALQRFEHALSKLITRAFWDKTASPAAVAQQLTQFPPLSKSLPSESPSARIKARLIEKFGHRSNRELAACVGIVSPDAPIMLSSAMAGNGTRKMRCAIALALAEPPSKLWPQRSLVQLRTDDAFYFALLPAKKRSE